VPESHFVESRSLRVTADFAVVAVDVEGQCDLRKNFKASLSPELFAQITAKGWI
jgi:hypothetical protein